MEINADTLVYYGDKRDGTVQPTGPDARLFDIGDRKITNKATTQGDGGEMFTTRYRRYTNLAGQNDDGAFDWYTLQVCYGGLSSVRLEQFDDCYNEMYRKIAATPSFNRAAVCAGLDDGFERLMLYAVHGLFFW